MAVTSGIHQIVSHKYDPEMGWVLLPDYGKADTISTLV